MERNIAQIIARPTEGQLALAYQIAEGNARAASGITHVPAAVYTDPGHAVREKALLFDRLPERRTRPHPA